MWRILFQLIRKIKRKIGTNWRFNQWKCWRRTKMSEYVIEEPLEFMAQNIIKSRSSLHAHRNTRIHFGIDYTYQYPMWMARISVYDGENWTIERGKKGNDFWYFFIGNYTHFPRTKLRGPTNSTFTQKNGKPYLISISSRCRPLSFELMIFIQ